jgi:MtN3 and saliva related transmembrane protein
MGFFMYSSFDQMDMQYCLFLGCSMIIQDWIGLVAGTLTTTAFVPQVYRIWQRKHADDISASMFIIFITGVALWFYYGLMLQAWPIIIANGITLILASTILFLKYYYQKVGRHNRE